MSQSNLTQSVLAGTAAKNIRMLVARGVAPISTGETLALLVFLLGDAESEIRAQAAQTLDSWDETEILEQLGDPGCQSSLLEYFARTAKSDSILQAVLANPSTPDTAIQSLAATVPAGMLEAILDNKVRIIRFPGILENVRKNPAAHPAILRLAQEIEVEFLGEKKKEYAVEESVAEAEPVVESVGLEFDIPPEDLSLEGLPQDTQAREAEILKRLAAMPVREKIRYALFGNREIRTMLVRDTNKEVARAVLKSPKLTENEVEAIAAMRSVAEDVLREIGNSKAWTKSYGVVQSLVKNPKSPPAISQRLLFRLRAQDLLQLTRDRSVPDAVRYNASRTLRQRTVKPG